MKFESDIPEKYKESYEELIRATELDMLTLWVGYVNGEKRVLLCIEVIDEENDDYIIYPYAVMIDHERDEVWDFDRRPMTQEDLPDEIRGENY